MPKHGKNLPGLTRRDTLKLSGLTLGGLAMAGAGRAAAQCRNVGGCYPNDIPVNQYTYFDNLHFLPKWTPLLEDEMRITFLGTMIPPVRRVQQEMSVFVEVGWDREKGRAIDQVVFDLGSGTCANYGAAGIGYGRMDKIFIAHLHQDHMSDLGHAYAFGPASDRKSPMFVWGPGPSGLVWTDPEGNTFGPYDDGTRAFCEGIRKACRWNTEGFAFLGSRLQEYHHPSALDWGVPGELSPVGDDHPDDGWALYPIELPWQANPGVAYDNPTTGVKISHFPVIHDRQGSIGYKLEWNGLSMIYTSDTRPETNCIAMASGDRPVDVFIHEMILPPEIWAMKTLRLPEPLPYPSDPVWNETYESFANVIENSHTPQGAFGYILSQIDPRPRMTVATHFPVADDTVACALKSVKAHCPWVELGTNMIWSFDLMTLSVRPREIGVRRLRVNDFGWSPVPRVEGTPLPPKYWKWKTQVDGSVAKDSDPTAQLKLDTLIEPGSDTYCADGY